ncbi:Coiled-coil domain-containing protein 69 [Caenorhabditis elegans]|uniref:Coiled-coil domain-containing protein 69 n=1 Tax=Caenorhabditis elegans TaxID=6239 RepID=Q20885_CAEEL|nr:Coiled-coil domain-containing protein 69 [Caenorhabditis elegans]CAA93504.1 Coiled-coil domain-containing protein 69 [Caenorhabditis elegans]|eukprot:NP_501660.1 Uncharacterized protein CELE_F56D5.5 [Caenorhabditis elegans]
MTENVEYIRVLLKSSQAEVQMLREQNEFRDDLLKMFKVKLEVNALNNLPVRRNLSVEISNLETKKLKTEIAFLKEELGREGKKLTIANTVHEQLKKDLEAEKRNSMFLSELLTFYQNGHQPQLPAEDQFVDFLQTETRSVKEALKEKEEEVKRLLVDMEGKTFQNLTEKGRMEEEMNDAKREAQILRNEMKSLQKNMTAKENELLGYLRDASETHTEMQKDYKIQILELQRRNRILERHLDNIQ